MICAPYNNSHIKIKSYQITITNSGYLFIFHPYFITYVFKRKSWTWIMKIFVFDTPSNLNVNTAEIVLLQAASYMPPAGKWMFRIDKSSNAPFHAEEQFHVIEYRPSRNSAIIACLKDRDVPNLGCWIFSRWDQVQTMQVKQMELNNNIELLFWG